MSTQPQPTGFLGALFDLSFSNFITARLIRVIYILGLIITGLASLFLLGYGFLAGFLAGVAMLIIAPLMFLLGAMYLRVILELLIVMFRIAENVEKIATRTSSPV